MHWSNGSFPISRKLSQVLRLCAYRCRQYFWHNCKFNADNLFVIGNEFKNCVNWKLTPFLLSYRLWTVMLTFLTPTSSHVLTPIFLETKIFVLKDINKINWFKNRTYNLCLFIVNNEKVWSTFIFIFIEIDIQIKLHKTFSSIKFIFYDNCWYSHF